MKSIEDMNTYFANRQSLGIKPGLERMNALLEKLQHPEEKLHVIHVAGTNGKGSTVQMIANTLMAHEYRVGIFSSPSFTGLAGHFIINNEEIKEQELLSIMNQLLPIIAELDSQGQSPTEFEIITALALVYFHNRVDIAIIEAGMGGRYDTTNCVHPIASVITSIALDHEEFLGETLAEIAYHKAGIIKPNRPVIVGPLTDEAKAVVDKEAQDKHALIYHYETDYLIRAESEELLWSGPNQESGRFNLQLAGKHQAQNAATALMTLAYTANKLSFQLDWDKVGQVMATVKLPGRFEQVTKNPKIIVDSAHNIAGIEAFIKTAARHENDLESSLIFAGFADKRLDEMIDRLLEASFSLTLTTFDHKRAAVEADFAKILKNNDKVAFTNDWKSVIEDFLTNEKQGKTLWVTGSLHFVMLVRQFIQETIYKTK